MVILQVTPKGGSAPDKLVNRPTIQRPPPLTVSE